MTIAFQQALAELRPEEVDFIMSQLPPPPVEAVSDPVAETTDASSDSETDSDAEGRRRRRIERIWPDAGTILSADYYGTTYTAEIIPASKRLKSGRQLCLTSGPAQGVVCDSFSEAMIAATEQQRTDQNLGRRGVSNGWVFWQWTGKPPEYNEARPDSDE